MLVSRAGAGARTEEKSRTPAAKKESKEPMSESRLEQIYGQAVESEEKENRRDVSTLSPSELKAHQDYLRGTWAKQEGVEAASSKRTIMTDLVTIVLQKMEIKPSTTSSAVTTATAPQYQEELEKGMSHLLGNDYNNFITPAKKDEFTTLLRQAKEHALPLAEGIATLLHHKGMYNDITRNLLIMYPQQAKTISELLTFYPETPLPEKDIEIILTLEHEQSSQAIHALKNLIKIHHYEYRNFVMKYVNKADYCYEVIAILSRNGILNEENIRVLDSNIDDIKNIFMCFSIMDINNSPISQLTFSHIVHALKIASKRTIDIRPEDLKLIEARILKRAKGDWALAKPIFDKTYNSYEKLVVDLFRKLQSKGLLTEDNLSSIFEYPEYLQQTVDIIYATPNLTQTLLDAIASKNNLDRTARELLTKTTLQPRLFNLKRSSPTSEGDMPDPLVKLINSYRG